MSQPLCGYEGILFLCYLGIFVGVGVFVFGFRLGGLALLGCLVAATATTATFFGGFAVVFGLLVVGDFECRGSMMGAGSSAVVAAASVSAVLSSAFSSSGVAGSAGATSGFGSGRGSGLGAGAGFCLGFGFCAGAGFGSSGAVSVFGSTGFACSFFGAGASFLGFGCCFGAASFLGSGLSAFSPRERALVELLVTELLPESFFVAQRYVLAVFVHGPVLQVCQRLVGHDFEASSECAPPFAVHGGEQAFLYICVHIGVYVHHKVA